MSTGIGNTGYRFRIYLFSGIMVFLVITSFAFTFGVAWYSKQVTETIVEKDFKAREIEFSMVDILLSMDRNRRKHLLLEKPEYEDLYDRDSERFIEALTELESLGMPEKEYVAWKELRERFWDYLQQDPFSLSNDHSVAEGVSDLPLEEVHALIRLNQGRMDLRIAQMNRLEEKTVQMGISWAGLSVLVAILCAYFLIRSITRPIDLLQKGTKEIAEGKFSHRVELATRDELGDLAEAFNEMAYQLKKLDDMKAEFIAIVSHELKTPLTSMKEAVELLLEETAGPLSEGQQHLLQINASGIRKLAAFVDEILNLTRMEGGMAPLYRTWFDFEKILGERLNIFRLLADKKQIRLSAECRPAPFPRVFGDVERLKQVLANLLNNAILYTPSGGEIGVYVETVGNKGIPQRARESLRHVDAKQWVRIRVSDTGQGIPVEERRRVFDKFYQIEKTSKRGTGSGLGLAIARHIVEAHGGVIWVEDSSGPGAVLAFALPLDGLLKEHMTWDGASLKDVSPPEGAPDYSPAGVQDFV